MTPQPELDGLLDEIGTIDAKLVGTIRQLETDWRRADPRHDELTERVALALRRAVGAGLCDVATMVHAFNRFAGEFHERQLDFLRSGSYRENDYDQVTRDVYANDPYMESVYYPALLLSYLAAPNYRHILRALDATIARWRAAGVARILDVASGHGLLLLLALEELPAARGVAIDVAPAALRFASALQQATGWGEGRFSFELMDVLAASPSALGGPFDAAICCELLEHVPQPARFLAAIHGRLVPQGRLFLTAAVRMESVDHLTLFASIDELTQLLGREGYRLEHEASVPFVTRPPRDETHRRELLADPRLAATFVAECVRSA
jgi:2-polyprenyl-3-methyl-5-hydroxy-6-metoxy-1,4-benzoquinol methylase